MQLPYHQKRLEYSYWNYFRRRPTYLLRDTITVPNNFSKGLVKLRFIYGKEDYKSDFSLYRPRIIRHLKLIESNTINYLLKFVNRSQINALLKHRKSLDDILIVKNGFITDTSTANIVFDDGKEWLTPSTPLLAGTCRARLLDEGLVREAMIPVNELQAFKQFALINAMIGDDRQWLPISNIHQ